MRLRCFARLWFCPAFLIGCVSSTPGASAQIPAEYALQPPKPEAQIKNAIDESRLVTLRGNTHPLARVENDRGPAPADLPLRRILMLLHRSPQQGAALDSLLASQQDPASPFFHHWLSPEQFGDRFGASAADAKTITDWLRAHGFVDIGVNKGGTVVEFTGTAGQVRQTFHTEIHQYQAAGGLHWANQSDPKIPAAFAPVVAGLVSLNDFGRHSLAIRGDILRQRNGEKHYEVVHRAHPEFTITNPGEDTVYAVGPYDFASIYDLAPLWNAGVDGTGQTIAIVGETEINPTDPQYFRAFFGLPPNNPKVVLNGIDPGIQPDETEADLDVEWSGAVAKGAQILLVTSATTETTAGVDLSALYIVDNNLAPVMSESYGGCELELGTAGNAFEAGMWQQASAEGITVLVASGDEGSAACDPTADDANLAVHPMAVNGLASSAYNIAVGGTDFNQDNEWSKYWSMTNNPTTKASALGYIPEVPWNDSCGSSTLAAIYGETAAEECDSGGFLNTIAGSGGPSSCISSDGTNASSCTGG